MHLLNKVFVHLFIHLGAHKTFIGHPSHAGAGDTAAGREFKGVSSRVRVPVAEGGRTWGKQAALGSDR